MSINQYNKSVIGMFQIVFKIIACIIVVIAVCFRVIIWYCDYTCPSYHLKEVGALYNEELVLSECPQVLFSEEDEQHFQSVLLSGIIDTVDLQRETIISGDEAAQLLGLDSVRYSDAKIRIIGIELEKEIETEYAVETHSDSTFWVDLWFYGYEHDHCPVYKISEQWLCESESTESACIKRQKKVFSDVEPIELNKGVIKYGYYDLRYVNAELTIYESADGVYKKSYIRLVKD